MRTIFLALFFAFAATSCNNADFSPAQQSGESFGFATPDKSSPYLAYEHWVGVAIEEDSLTGQYETLVAACSADRNNECTVLDAQISLSYNASATIRLRVLPAGVQALVDVATEGAEVVEKRTHVEDLEEAISDVEARIAMLTTIRDKLLDIESRAVDDVDSLIKVASELTRVQSELEQLLGQNAAQRQRIEKQILTVRFVTAESTSFLAPVAFAFSQFGQNLAEGIGDTVKAIAYLLPWSILLFLVVLAVRHIWRRGRHK